jgi:hypothetical protein
MFSKSSLQMANDMRTKRQQTCRERNYPMIQQIKSAATRSQDTLLGDAIGMAALMVMLVGGLFLPGLS